MSRYDKPVFNPADTFEARRAFTYNGTKYAMGKSFPWRKIACSPRKLRDLFNGNFITSSTAKAEKAAAKKAVAKKAVAKKPAKKVEKVEKRPKPKVVDYDEKTGVVTTQSKKVDKSTDEDIKAFVNDQN